jgi:hypothetical protein
MKLVKKLGAYAPIAVKLLSNQEARLKVGRIYAPIAVKLLRQSVDANLVIGSSCQESYCGNFSKLEKYPGTSP